MAISGGEGQKEVTCARRLRLPGSELSGEARRKTPEVLVSEPKESSDLTIVIHSYLNVVKTQSHYEKNASKVETQRSSV